MYAVVGCSECQALWIVADDPDTSECPRCGSRRQRSKRRTFFESEDRDAARQARARLLAERQDAGDAFDALEDVASQGQRVDDVGPGDDEYLAASGVDPDAAAAAGERAGTGAGGSQSRREIVLAAFEDDSAITESTVVDYASDRGVPPERVRELLTKLERAGQIVRDGDELRMV